ncbi:hypothetical protein [Erythrobacter sp. HL-111]|uniref:hypothetical protein n=1 Tax=Erythrobacter sp. HL-111 TaxID=1798193 RepID=UPI0006DAD536|nr:hypothetical protein [Erythrobacter sp. HL-111]KPP94101.1 MAG: hypothetical protein HLUCCO15_05115 [Erythrobacteraceae bacterium HL-111]SDS62470.1 hypothetical protein SAMN04515621_1907 [Erythrobacter sp. HL-111]
MMAPPHPAATGCKTRRRVHPRWRERFIAELEQTSCVRLAAERAGVSPARAYRARKTEAEFDRAWGAALAMGYEDLEMEVLRRLRQGDFMTQDGTKYDFAGAIRLLALRRDATARAEPERRDVTPAEIRASIDRKIADIRHRIAGEEAAGEPAA